MDIKGLLKFYQEQTNKSVEECLSQDLTEIEQMKEYANLMADNGKDIIISKINEGDFVKVIDVIENLVLAAMMTQGAGKGLLLEKMSGNLQGFSHTMILTVLGILADEEVV